MATNDPCLIYNVKQLQDMARGKIPGFSRLRKQELCQALIRARLLPIKEEHKAEVTHPLPIKEEPEAEVVAPTTFRGLEPPEWDFDR